MSKLLIIAGVFLVLMGIGWMLGLGRLPGDVVIRRGNFTFFFPIVTAVLLSILLTILLNFFTSRER